MSNTNATFWKVINEHQIVIPDIQRDYVQGRKTKAIESARDRLLDDILSACLTRNAINLNFVYGKIDCSDNGNRFIPLDGQQRLTTLFLLHWFALYKDPDLPDSANEALANFSYETRHSSKEFFLRLIAEDNIAELRESSFDKLSTAIRDKHWFRPEWELDPTVQSSLVMLDCLSIRFGGIDDLWGMLTGDACPIVFEWLDVESIGNEDDLYIKMNARGKLLSAFENLKAELEEAAAGVLSDYQLHDLAVKLDVSWNDFFWRFGEPYQECDDRFLSAMDCFLLNRWSTINEVGSEYSGRKPGEGRMDETRKRLGERTLDDYYKQLPVNANLIDAQFLSEISFVLDYASSPDALEAVQQIVYRCSGGKDLRPADYFDSFMLKSLSSFLVGTNGEFPEGAWNAWIRIMLNLGRNSGRYQGFNTLGRYSNGIKCIDSLGVHAKSIVEAFADESVSISGISPDELIPEERKKAALILQSDEWRDFIFRAESMPYFQGKIDFLLVFSGIHELADCKPPDPNAIQTFTRLLSAIEELFDEKGLCCDGTLFRRALLTKGDFSLGEKQLRSYIVNDDRSIDWRGYLRMYNEEHQRANAAFAALLEDFANRDGSTTEKLQQIVAEYQWNRTRKDWWAKDLIENERLFKELGTRYQFKEISNRWKHPMLFMPVGANRVANGRNKELHLAKIVVSRKLV